jgi:hypothetical protein
MQQCIRRTQAAHRSVHMFAQQPSAVMQMQRARTCKQVVCHALFVFIYFTQWCVLFLIAFFIVAFTFIAFTFIAFTFIAFDKCVGKME